MDSPSEPSRMSLTREINDCESSEKFKKFMHELIDNNGVLNDVRAYLRSHIIQVLKSLETGIQPLCQKHFTKRLELTSQAINILILEYFLHLNFNYTVSVFLSELPLANMVFDFSKRLLHFDTAGSEPSRLRFSGDDVQSILQCLAIKCDSILASQLMEAYKAQERTPLLQLILKYATLRKGNDCLDDNQSTSSRSSVHSEGNSKCGHMEACKQCRNDIARVKAKFTEDEQKTFEKIRDLYDSEIEIHRAEDQRKLEQALAERELQLCKKYKMMEQSLIERERESSQAVEARKRFLWGLAQALRSQHARLRRAMSAARRQHAALQDKENSLKAQMAETEQQLRSRGEDMRLKISQELVLLESHVEAMKIERESISRERQELEELRKSADMPMKEPNIECAVRDDELCKHYELLTNELVLLKKYIQMTKLEPKCVVERSTSTDAHDLPKTNKALNNEHEMEKNVKEEKIMKPNQLVNELRKQKNVNFNLPKCSANQEPQQERNSDPMSPDLSLGDNHAMKGLLDENHQLRVLAKQLRDRIALLSAQQERLERAAAATLPRNIWTTANLEPESVGCRNGAGEEIGAFGNAHPRILVPGDAWPFIGVSQNRQSHTTDKSPQRSCRQQQDNSPKPVPTESKQKLKSQPTQPRNTKDKSPESVVREAKLRLRRLEIEAETVDQCYREFRQRQAERRESPDFRSSEHRRESPDFRSCRRESPDFRSREHRELPDFRSSEHRRESPDFRSSEHRRESPDFRSSEHRRESPDFRSSEHRRESPDFRSSEHRRESPDFRSCRRESPDFRSREPRESLDFRSSEHRRKSPDFRSSEHRRESPDFRLREHRESKDFRSSEHRRESPNFRSSEHRRESPDFRSSEHRRESPDFRSCRRESPDFRSREPRESLDLRSSEQRRESPDFRSSEQRRESPDFVSREQRRESLGFVSSEQRRESPGFVSREQREAPDFRSREPSESREECRASPAPRSREPSPESSEVRDSRQAGRRDDSPQVRHQSRDNPAFASRQSRSTRTIYSVKPKLPLTRPDVKEVMRPTSNTHGRFQTKLHAQNPVLSNENTPNKSTSVLYRYSERNLKAAEKPSATATENYLYKPLNELGKLYKCMSYQERCESPKRPTSPVSRTNTNDSNVFITRDEALKKAKGILNKQAELEILKKNLTKMYNLNELPTIEGNNALDTEIKDESEPELDASNTLLVEIENTTNSGEKIPKSDQSNLVVIVKSALDHENALDACEVDVSGNTTLLISPNRSVNSLEKRESAGRKGSRSHERADVLNDTGSDNKVLSKLNSPKRSLSPEQAAKLTKTDVLDATFDSRSETIQNLRDSSNDSVRNDAEEYSDCSQGNTLTLSHSQISVAQSPRDDIFWDQ